MSILNNCMSAVKTGLGATKAFLRVNYPHILVGTGITTMVGGGAYACVKTYKELPEVVAHHNDTVDTIEMAMALPDDNELHLDTKEAQKASIKNGLNTAKEIAEVYALPTAVVAAGAAMIIGGHVVITKRLSATTAAYAALAASFEAYRKRVSDVYGAQEDAALSYGPNTCHTKNFDTGEERDVTTVDANPSPYLFLFDETNPWWSNNDPIHNKEFLMSVERQATERLRRKLPGDVLTLNEVLEMLGIPGTDTGLIAGWKKGNGDNFVDFGLVGENIPENTRKFMIGESDYVILNMNCDGLVYGKVGQPTHVNAY